MSLTSSSTSFSSVSRSSPNFLLPLLLPIPDDPSFPSSFSYSSSSPLCSLPSFLALYLCHLYQFAFLHPSSHPLPSHFVPLHPLIPSLSLFFSLSLSHLQFLFSSFLTLSHVLSPLCFLSLCLSIYLSS